MARFDAKLERIARAIARVHFTQKMPYGICPHEERVEWQVDHYWKNHLPHARAAIEANADNSYPAIMQAARAEQTPEEYRKQYEVHWLPDPQREVAPDLHIIIRADEPFPTDKNHPINRPWIKR